MGCDIHWYSETKRNEHWICDQGASFHLEHADGEEYFVMNVFPGRDRNYWFFGLLNEGVRCEWPWSFTYADEFPEDASPEIRKLYKQWDRDAHSCNFKTRAELKTKLEDLRLARVEVLVAADEYAKLEITVEHINELIDCLERVIAGMVSDVPDTDQRLIYWFDN